MLLLLTLVLLGSSTAFKFEPDQSIEYLLSLTQSRGGAPPGIPADFDCAWREAASPYALKIQPSLTIDQQKQIHDALQLTTLCGKEFTPTPPAPFVPLDTAPSDGARYVARPELFVDAASGKDSNTGSITSPLQTIAAAVAASRKSGEQATGAATIIQLRKGVFYLAESVVLQESDSGLTIKAYNNEDVEITLQWSPSATNPSIHTTKVPKALLSGAAVRALQINGKRATLARYPNANPELDLFPFGYIANKTAWMQPRYNGTVCANDRKECGQAKDVNFPSLPNEWHGQCVKPTNWETFHTENLLENTVGLLRIPLLRSDEATHQCPLSKGYQEYAVGVGGGCDVYDPPYSPWCSSSFYRCRWGEMHYRKPAGFQPGHLLPHAPYKNPTELVVHAWRPGHWYSWMFEVNGTTSDGNLTFGRGGNQGGEGSDSASEWWVEGVQEELDAPNEFYYDADTETLSLYYNGTGTPPADGLVIPTLANMIELRGDQEKPVRNVSFLGLKVTANRPTFMEPRTNPSGGDWALERMGALLVEGSEDLLVQNCIFTKLDSNAISINGYNRRATIDSNHFSWLGQNAIASWGRSEYNNGTNGNFPRFTRVTNNFATEVGVIQKQSSMYFQAETAEATIDSNICFNIPRAAINFNDGFGGGAEMSNNLLFNTCRESSDHGAFNSWDRLPYITTVRTGEPSTIPAFNNVHHNFIVANYAADGGCLDNDDGSSYYKIHHNFCVFGGHKSDFDGNSKISSNNIHVYPSVYSSTCVGELQGSVPKGYAEGYLNNICILPSSKSTYMGVNINGLHCDGSDKSLQVFADGFITSNNTVFVPGGTASTVCNHVTFNATNWMLGIPSMEMKNKSWGYDNTSRVSGDVPSSATIIKWAEDLLGGSEERYI